MSHTDKQALVDELGGRLAEAPVIYLTDFTGLDVKAITRLRSVLRESGAEYVVVKNRLARRAFEGTTLPDVSGSLQGPTGVVLAREDPVTAAKAVSDFAREHDSRPAFKLGLLEENVLVPEQIERLARLPSRPLLLAELAGAFEAPLAALAGALGGKLQEMAGLLEALGAERGRAA